MDHQFHVLHNECLLMHAVVEIYRCDPHSLCRVRVLCMQFVRQGKQKSELSFTRTSMPPSKYPW